MNKKVTMWQKYLHPTFELITFDTADVIRTSGEVGGESQGAQEATAIKWGEAWGASWDK